MSLRDFIVKLLREQFISTSDARAQAAADLAAVQETCFLLYQDKTRYVRYSELKRLEAAYHTISAGFGFWAKASSWSLARKFGTLRKSLKLARKIRTEHNATALEAEISASEQFFKDLGRPLDEQQKRAVVLNDNHVLVVAGAGSGKTTVIAARVAYLIKRQNVMPSKIRLLTFTKAAAEEMKSRIKESTGCEIEASTFHSFGYEIIRKLEKKTFLRESQNIERFLAELLREACQSSTLPVSALPAYFSKYFEPCSADETFGMTKERYQRLNPGAPIATLSGERVRSLEEKRIADFLFLNGVKFKYESLYRGKGEDDLGFAYRPDFYLSEYDLYLEHFGINRKNQAPKWFDDPETYVADMKRKKKLHRQQNTKLICTYSYMVWEGDFEAKLDALLKSNGVSFESLADEEKLAATNQALEGARFYELLAAFLTLYKYSGKSLDDLTASAKSMFAGNSYHQQRASLFLEIFSAVYRQYDSILKSTNQIDFADMVILAKRYLTERSEELSLDYEYLIVDEFQDTDAVLVDILKSVEKGRPDNQLFCVGDDWQSIYKFKGSDVGLMLQYEQHFEGAVRTDINTNYRSLPRIVDLGKLFVGKNPAQLRKNVLSAKKNPLIAEYPFEFLNIELLEQRIDAIAKRDGAGETSIFVLGRFNDDRPQFFRNQDMIEVPGTRTIVTFSTIHKSKGLEADYVFVVSPRQQTLTFPSTIEDDPLLRLVRTAKDEEFPHAEERRLMYVAITRARKQACFVFRRSVSESIFFKELQKDLGQIKITREI